MKHSKNMLLAALMLFVSVMATGQSQKSSYQVFDHKNSLHIGYSLQSLKPEYGGKLDSQYGFYISRSFYTFYFHKKPIANILKLGADIGMTDNYVRYQDDNPNDLSHYSGPTGYTGDKPLTDEDASESDLPGDKGIHQLDAGIKVGLTAVVNPVSALRVAVYAHVVPSLSFFYNHSEANWAFVPFFDYGMEVSYKFIGLGIEMAQGTGAYKAITKPEGITGSLVKTKYDTNSLRLYLSLIF